jgi:transcription initiation factor TFIIIB Brf1 subunit/transcription initiation factor TFIIB
MRGPEPRAPEHEIPRPSGAGVGAPSLAFELGVCPECGGRIVEHGGLLVCKGCGLVVAPVYEPPRLELDGSALAPAPVVNPARGFFERAVEAVAGELGIPAKAALELYRRLKALAKPEEAAAVALFVTAKRSGSYASLARVCELLERCGVKVAYPRAVRAMLACGALIRPTLEEALEVYAQKLGLSESVKREALAILKRVKPYAGGRDPYIVALAAIYLASGAFTIYSLAKLAGRSPGRLHENVRFILRHVRGGVA